MTFTSRYKLETCHAYESQTKYRFKKHKYKQNFERKFSPEQINLKLLKFLIIFPNNFSTQYSDGIRREKIGPENFYTKPTRIR